jgi:hypothetical protein
VVLTFGLGPLTQAVITSLFVTIHQPIRIVSEAATCGVHYGLSIPPWKAFAAFQLSNSHPDFDWSRTQRPDEPFFLAVSLCGSYMISFPAKTSLYLVANPVKQNIIEL